MSLKNTQKQRKLSFSKSLLSLRKKKNTSHKEALQHVQSVHGKRIPNIRQVFHAKKILSQMEYRILKIALFIIGISVLLLSWNFLNTYRTEVPKVGGKLTEAVVGSPEFINPLYASLNDIDMDLVYLIFSSLVRYNEKNEIVSDLAESFEISEDKKVYTFHLRKNVLWHKQDQNEEDEIFNADDVVFTFDMIQNPEVKSPLLSTFQGVKIEKKDDFTVVFTLEEAFAPFLSSLTFGILPEHVWSDIDASRFLLTNKNRQPIGTGPYVFDTLQKNADGYLLSYTLKRNEQFYRQPPYIEEFVFKFFGEYDDAIQELREKKVDTLHFVPFELRSKLERKYLQLHTLQLPQYTAMFFQLENIFLKDDDIRKALTIATDKNRIMKAAIGDDGEVLNGPILPDFPGFSDELETEKFSIDTANEILDKKWKRISLDEYKTSLKDVRLEDWEKLYKENNPVPEEGNATTTLEYEETKQEALDIESEMIDNDLNKRFQSGQTFFRKDEDDNILSLHIVTADRPEYRKAADIIASLWHEIGIDLVLDFKDPKSMNKTVFKERNFDILLYRMIMGSDPDQYPFWHSAQVNYPGLNLSHYVNEDVDTLLEEIRTLSGEEQALKYQELQTTILEDKPALFLYIPTYTYASSDKIKGLRFEKIFSPSNRFIHVDEWYIDTKWDWK